jgi:hypothetical protein
MLPVSATCYDSTAIYPEADHVIWTRSRDSELEIERLKKVRLLTESAHWTSIEILFISDNYTVVTIS